MSTSPVPPPMVEARKLSLHLWDYFRAGPSSKAFRDASQAVLTLKRCCPEDRAGRCNCSLSEAAEERPEKEVFSG